MKLFNKKTKHGGGFTLIELMITVGVISILSGIVITVINPAALRARGRDAQRIADLKKLQTALELYYADNRLYPPSGSFATVSASLGALVTDYIPSLPVDPLSTHIGAYSCGGVFTYSYKTNAIPASRYVLVANMETAATASDYVVCNTVPNCATTSLNCNCATLCHAVQNPL